MGEGKASKWMSACYSKVTKNSSSYTM